MKYLTVVQHSQPEWLGHLEDHLEGRGIRFGYHRPFTTGGKVPDIATVGDGLILLGSGGWGAATPGHLLPTLDVEIRLARACLMLNKPILAIGLGAQILSLAADGGVEQAPLTLSAGYATRVIDTALEGMLPACFPHVVFMRDRVRPPDYAQVLACDEAGHAAVFQIGRNAFGFTGHPGVRRAMIEELIMETDDAPANSGEALTRIGELATAIEDALVPIMTGLVGLTGWMEVHPT
jgi:GMP synthase-like glutamine amidotransferase